MNYLDELKNTTNQKPPVTGSLFNGISISVGDFIKFVGGPSNFKKIINGLEKVLISKMKTNEPIGQFSNKFEHAREAEIWGQNKPGELAVSYDIWAVDSTGHMMTARYWIYYKNGKSDMEVISGWDG